MDGATAALLRQTGTGIRAEAFHHSMAASDRTEADRRRNFWLDACGRLPAFKASRKLLCTWRDSIRNAFEICLPMALLKAATTPSRRSNGLPLAVRISPASAKEFCYLFYTPTFDAEPIFPGAPSASIAQKLGHCHAKKAGQWLSFCQNKSSYVASEYDHMAS